MTLSSHPLAFAWSVTKPYLRWAVLAVLTTMLASGLGGLMSFVLKLVTDEATAIAAGQTETALLWQCVVLYPIVFLLSEMSWRASGLAGMQWFTKMEVAGSERLFEHMLQHSADYFNNRFAGALVSKLGNAVEGAFNVMRRILWQFLPVGVSFVVGITIASIASPWLGLVFAVWFIAFLALNVTLVLGKQKYAIAEAEANSTLRGVMVDSTSNVASVQLSGNLRHEFDHVRGFIEAKRKANVMNWWTSEWILGVSSILQTILVGIMFAASIWLFLEGAITLGDIVMVTTFTLHIMGIMSIIGNEIMYFMNDYSQMKEGLTDLLQPRGIVEGENAHALTVRNAAIDFDNITFGYGRKKNVFEGFDLHIPSGQRVGLVGKSGSGKTTFVSLLLRQYDVQGGVIRVGGEDVSSVTLESLRKAIAIVPQDIALFHRTIRENIRYGRLDATDDDVRTAAVMAHAEEFIKELPQQDETLVGERGVKLSGGQRQRIAIARAILKNSPILILDEATSAMDSEGEGLIQEALWNLMRGKTVIAIAHRLSTLKAMDRILVLDEGTIAEDGTHEQLLANNGLYAQLWQSQVSGFIQED